MKTAMLSWIHLNPTVKIIDTKKKFFNQYLYKVTVYVPGGRLMYDSKFTADTAMDLIHQRVEYSKINNYSSWMRHHVLKTVKLLQDARVDQLTYWQDKKLNSEALDIKLRVEEPHLSIYSNNESQLFSLIQNNYSDRLLEVHTPINDLVAKQLNNGEIFLKKVHNYQYKIVLRECRIEDLNQKLNLLDYLYNLQDDVRLTKSVKRNLSSRNRYFNGGYFYAKDDKILTFINLISPNIIAGIYKIINNHQ